MDRRSKVDTDDSADETTTATETLLADLRADVASLTLESHTLQEMLETQAQAHAAELDKVQAQLAFKTGEASRLSGALVEIKRELKSTKDLLVHSSIHAITKTPVSPRKRTRQPLSPLSPNIPSSPTKHVALETTNETLTTELRLLKTKLSTLTEDYDRAVERCALLETEATMLREQTAKLTRNMGLEKLEAEAQRQTLLTTNHELHARLDSWTLLMTKSDAEKAILQAKCTKLERIARLVALRDRGAPAAFKTPALTTT